MLSIVESYLNQFKKGNIFTFDVKWITSSQKGSFWKQARYVQIVGWLVWQSKKEMTDHLGRWWP